MPIITIDGVRIEIPEGTPLIEACEAAGVEIPRFCYHARLSVAGNCRMCLVEVEKNPKLVASCAQPVMDGMVVDTKSEKIKNARHGVMEFLLANHPLDCPICDQGGECDLQDQAMAYGFDRGRFLENKRAVEEKQMGPLIKTEMTRCIHCTRCVRFASEVAGIPELGSVGRGEDMEIIPAIEGVLQSELSGNIVDLCPVGALTSKPYAFTARPWELKSTETIDVMDALGSNIRVDSKGREVMRILPRIHEDINEEWISDKTRFCYDGLKSQRLDRPYLRDEEGRLVAVSWGEALEAVAKRIREAESDKIAAIAGDLACAESIKSLKDLMQALGSPHKDCRQEGAMLKTEEGRWSYLFNSGIAGIDKADALLLIGSCPRLEAPILNMRIRKRWLKGDFPIAAVGEKTDFAYDVKYLGSDLSALLKLSQKTGPFSQILKRAKNPMLILGMGALARPDGRDVFAAARKIAKDNRMFRDDWNGFNVLHIAAARVAALDLNFLPEKGGMNVRQISAAAKKGALDVLYLLQADELDVKNFKDTFVIYQGTHGDKAAQFADAIFPAAAWTEKNALWANLEGRIQEGRLVVFPPGDAREDWQILRALSEKLEKPLPYDSQRQLRRQMEEDAPHFAQRDILPQPTLPPRPTAARPKSPTPSPPKDSPTP